MSWNYKRICEYCISLCKYPHFSKCFFCTLIDYKSLFSSKLWYLGNYSSRFIKSWDKHSRSLVFLDLDLFKNLRFILCLNICYVWRIHKIEDASEPQVLYNLLNRLLKHKRPTEVRYHFQENFSEVMLLSTLSFYPNCFAVKWVVALA